MLRIQGLFAIPFAFDVHPDPARLNIALRKLFLEREREGVRYANPAPYTARNSELLFESHFDLFMWPEPEIVQLREFCLSRIVQAACELNNYDAAARRSLRVRTDAWFHITRRNGYFGVHNHPLASWSGVYCVASGEHDANQPDSGALTFIHPNSSSSMYIDPGNEFLKPPFSSGNTAYRLLPGQLILFPSWVLHQVAPFFGDGERITVAFNCAFYREG
jgi:uncharacterized protein (TIGR02466 family)